MGHPTCTLPCPAPTCLPQVQGSPLGLLWPQDKAQAGGTCRAVYQRPGHLFQNRKKPGSHHRGRCSLPRCSRPPDRVLGMTPSPGSRQIEPDLHRRVWKSHPGTCFFLSLRLFLGFHPVCPALLRRGGGSWGSPGSGRERGGPVRMPTFPGGPLAQDAVVGC